MGPSLVTVPGYVAGVWTIDPMNTDVSFSVRHLGVARVHGRFNEVVGKIVTGVTPEDSSVSAVIAARSVDTGFPARDTYIKGTDVLSVDEFQELAFTSTGLRAAGEEFLLDGDLSIRGVTRPVVLTVSVGGFGADPNAGRDVFGISASVTIRRRDFNLAPNVPAGVIGENVDLQLDIQAAREN